MRELDEQGFFWLPSKPEHRVAGRLKFDGTEEARLELIGTLVNLADLNNFDEEIRIHGIAGTHELTLDKCHVTGVSLGFPGVSGETFRASVVVAGAYFEEDEPLTFNAIILGLQHFEHWLDRSGIRVKADMEQSNNAITQYQVTYSPLAVPSVDSSLGKLSLRPALSTSGDYITTSTIREKWGIVIRLQEFLPLADIEKICSALQNLITIGVDAPSYVTELSLSHADGKRRRRKTASGDIIYDPPAELYMPWPGYDSRQESVNPYPPRMLFNFDDLGGLEGVARWLETAQKYEAVIGSLVSHWYIPEMYTDNRFFNVYTAAESLVRIRMDKQNINPFKKHLRTLAEEAGPTFQVLVGDINKWTNQVVKSRMNSVVHRGLHETDASSLYLLSEATYFLVVLSLLRECGVPEDQLARLQNHHRFGRLSEEIRALP